MRVIKVGGRVQSDPALIAAIAADTRQCCIVHGGGDEISQLQRKLGLDPAFVQGRRVTSAADIDLVRMALTGLSNQRLVAALVSAGVSAVGVSGEDAGWIQAEVVAGGTLGLVGSPVDVDTALLLTLLNADYLPVISPVARAADADGAGGSTLNVNGDDAAASIAIALGAEELLFVTDVAGVRVSGTTTPHLDAEGVTAMIARGEAGGGMEPKLNAALRALSGGVPRVRIGSLDMILDNGTGTLIESVETVA